MKHISIDLTNRPVGMLGEERLKSVIREFEDTIFCVSEEEVMNVFWTERYADGTTLGSCGHLKCSKRQSAPGCWQVKIEGKVRILVDMHTEDVDLFIARAARAIISSKGERLERVVSDPRFKVALSLINVDG